MTTRRTVTILSWTLGVVVVAALAAGYLLWHNYQAALDDNDQLKSDVAALRARGSSGDSTGLGVTQPNDGSVAGTNTSSGASSGARTMLVKDFGIKFQVPADLTDLTYAESPPASGFLQLTTQSLQTKGTDCGGAGILGALFRYPKGQPLPSSAAAGQAQTLATAGSYDYYYLPLASNPCKDKTALGTIASLTAEVKTALKTISEQ